MAVTPEVGGGALPGSRGAACSGMRSIGVRPCDRQPPGRPEVEKSSRSRMATNSMDDSPLSSTVKRRHKLVNCHGNRVKKVVVVICAKFVLHFSLNRGMRFGVLQY